MFFALKVMIEIFFIFVSIFFVILSTKLYSIRKSWFWEMFISSIFSLIINIISTALLFTSYFWRFDHEYNNVYLIVFYACSLFNEFGMIFPCVLISICMWRMVNYVKYQHNKKEIEMPSECGLGALVMAFGIMGIIGFVPCGIIAWVIGKYDLACGGDKNMSNWQMTQIGMVLGKITTGFMIVISVIIFLYIMYLIFTEAFLSPFRYS